MALNENHDKLPSRNTVGSCLVPYFLHSGTITRCLGLSTLNSTLASCEDFMNLRIAVVDDNADILNKLISVLETEFDVVATATDGKSALESIRSCRPDVVLDLEMPLLNGIEVTRGNCPRFS